MFNSICTYPIRSDLFAQAIHPGSPLLALGLASGHVQLQRLPSSDPKEARNSTIETAWRTRRHKGSCRSLCFDHDGERMFSAGTDGIVKVAATETGQVASKIAVPLYKYVCSTTRLPMLVQMELANVSVGPTAVTRLIQPPSSTPSPPNPYSSPPTPPPSTSTTSAPTPPSHPASPNKRTIRTTTMSPL